MWVTVDNNLIIIIRCITRKDRTILYSPTKYIKKGVMLSMLHNSQHIRPVVNGFILLNWNLCQIDIILSDRIMMNLTVVLYVF